MLNRIKGYYQHPLLRNAAIVASGTAASQVISMAFSPLVTRLYGPQVYGLQSVFITVVGLISIPAAMTYPLAIVLPKNDADALGLAHLSIIIGAVMSFLTFLVLFLYGDQVMGLLNAKEISAYIFFIPVVVFISVLANTMSQWLIRKKAYALTAKAGVLTTLVASSTKAGVGYVSPGVSALIVIYACSGLLNTVLLWMGWKKEREKYEEKKELSKGGYIERMRFLARKYSDFAIYRTPQNLINGFSASLPAILLAAYFGSSSIAYFSIASTVLLIPASLIGNSVMQVFYPHVNESIHRGENVRGLIIKAMKGMAIVGIIPFGVVIAFGPSLFAFVFGEEWQRAGVYAQWLSAWLFFQYINKPAVAAIPALRLQRGLLIYELFSTGSKFVALYLGFIIYESDVAAIALFSIFGIIAYVWLILWVLSNSGRIAGVGVKSNGS